MAENLKQALKKRIVEDVLLAAEPDRQKVLIVDRKSVSLLDSAMRTNEVIDHRVTLIEQIDKTRQAFPLPAIYLLTPSNDVITKFIADYTRRGPPLYQAAHLFFTSTLDDILFKKLTKSPAAPYIKSVKELFVDFLAVESDIFTCGRPLAFNAMYAQNSLNVASELSAIAGQIASVCATLGEYPIIRYAKVNGLDRISGRLAGLVQERLDELCRIDTGYPKNDRPRGTMIVTDRSIDPIAPLLHEFTYQAMAADLLPLENNGKKYKFTFQDTATGNRLSKEHFLDEEVDPFWATLRHTHIAEVITKIIADFNTFLTDNKAATKGPGNVSSLKEMKEKMAALPQFQDLKAKFSAHLSMSQECMSIFEKDKLGKTAGPEQDMATGETAEGAHPKHIVADLVPLLSDTTISSYDKIRLLMLYIVFKKGVQDDDRRKLLDHAKISLEEQNAIQNLALLGVRLSQNPKKEEKKREKKAKKRADDVPFELSRYTPLLKGIIEAQIAGTLPTTDYPFVKELAPSGEGDRPKEVKSLRSTKPSWNKVNVKSQLSATRAANGRVLLFVAGGATYSEMRAVHEVAAASGREVILGATSILTPTVYIDSLKGLSKPVTLNDLQGGALTSSVTALADDGKHGASSSHRPKKESGRRRAPTEPPSNASQSDVHTASTSSMSSAGKKGLMGWFKREN